VLPRLLALSLSSLLALIVLWLGARWVEARRIAPLAVRFGTKPPAARSAVLSGLAALPGERLAPRTPEEWAFHMTPEQAGAFFAFQAGLSEYDPWCFARRTANFDMDMPWPEHAGGRIRIRTNSLGLREDHELSDPPSELRVLVAGDSHTDGVCENAESFSNRLEALLARRSGRSTEVLNAGGGGHSCFNYFGTWLRFRGFQPKVLVVAVYGGNDLSELLGPFLWFTGRSWPAYLETRETRRAAALEAAPHLMAQGLDQVETVHAFPAEMREMARTAAWLCGEIQRSARAAGKELVLLYIPSPYEVGPAGARPFERKLCLDLGLAPADFTAAAALGQSFLDAAAAEGIRVVDLRPMFRAEPRPPYWNKDLHLDLRGHELAAQALLPVVEPLVR
jgi:hypothetical protein